MPTEETIETLREKLEDVEATLETLREEAKESAETAEGLETTAEGLETRLREAVKLLYPQASPYELNLYIDGHREIGSFVCSQ